MFPFQFIFPNVPILSLQIPRKTQIISHLLGMKINTKVYIKKKKINRKVSTWRTDPWEYTLENISLLAHDSGKMDQV